MASSAGEQTRTTNPTIGKANSATTMAMEKIVREDSTLNASYLSRISQMQELVYIEARSRAGQTDDTNPRIGAVVGAAFSCLLAAWATWISVGQAQPFGELLDQAMSALKTV